MWSHSEWAVLTQQISCDSPVLTSSAKNRVNLCFWVRCVHRIYMFFIFHSCLNILALIISRISTMNRGYKFEAYKIKSGQLHSARAISTLSYPLLSNQCLHLSPICHSFPDVLILFTSFHSPSDHWHLSILCPTLLFSLLLIHITLVYCLVVPDTSSFSKTALFLIDICIWVHSASRNRYPHTLIGLLRSQNGTLRVTFITGSCSVGVRRTISNPPSSS